MKNESAGRRGLNPSKRRRGRAKSGQSPSAGHLEGEAGHPGESDAVKIRLVAEQSGIGLLEEVKNRRIYGYTLAVMFAKKKDYGRNASYLPNRVRDYALAARPKLGGCALIKRSGKIGSLRESPL